MVQSDTVLKIVVGGLREQNLSISSEVVSVKFIPGHGRRGAAATIGVDNIVDSVKVAIIEVTDRPFHGVLNAVCKAFHLWSQSRLSGEVDCRVRSEIFEFSATKVYDFFLGTVLGKSHCALESYGGDRNVSVIFSGKFGGSEHVLVGAVFHLVTSQGDLHILGLS